MYGYLTSGERRLPAKGQAIGAVPGSLGSSPHFLGSPVNIGILPAGKTVKIQYSVTVGPIGGNPQSVTSQGTVSGGNFSNVVTSDTEAGAGQPTVTLLAIAPAFTSANSTTFTVGTTGNFNVTANGAPLPSFSTSGLPSGVTLTSAGLLNGNPASGTGGVYNITITANNGIAPNATQSFTLTVNEAPSIRSASSTTFVVGTAGSFTVVSKGYPAPTFSEMGTLPSGVTLNSTTGVLSGTPGAGTGGTYPITLKASNGIGTDATQSFTLTVNQAPAITSGNSAAFTVGQAATFTVTATGFPTPTFSETGGLPNGISLDSTSGVLGGTPGANTQGTYNITITASNGISPNATQSFNLVVKEAPSLTVTTINDTVDSSDGVTSLREALIYAQSSGGPQTITFANTLAGQTVTLSSAWSNNSSYESTSALYVTGNITIQGLNFGVTLAVDSSVQRRHFFVDGAGSLTLSNLTLSGGKALTSGYAYGGSIWSFGNLTIHNCTFTGNTSNQEGGAIQCWGDSPSVSIDNSTISGNTSNGIGGAMDIGAATMTLRYVTMTNNTSPAGSGNAVSIYKNSATMINTLIVGNSNDTVVGVNGGNLLRSEYQQHSRECNCARANEWHQRQLS